MAPRKRRKDREDWPNNLYAVEKKKGLYFYYLRPDLPAKHKDRHCNFGYVILPTNDGHPVKRVHYATEVKHDNQKVQE